MDTAPYLFISDLHLSPSRPEISQQFESFLQGPARRARALFILGDLFEAWIGDDAAGRFEQRIGTAIRRFSDSAAPVYFLRGNRDFLLGEAFCGLAGMRLLEQPHVIELFGTPTLLLHGDILCTRDTAYQRYRRRVTDPEWQRRMLSRPLWVRRSIATALGLASRLRNRNPDDPRLDVCDRAVAAWFADTGAARMIHGHTHRPARHRHRLERDTRERIVLGDWYAQGSVLEITPERVELQSLPREPDV